MRRRELSGEARAWVRGTASGRQAPAVKMLVPVYEIAMDKDRHAFTEADIWAFFDTFVETRFSQTAPDSLRPPVMEYVFAVLDYVQAAPGSDEGREAFERARVLHASACAAVDEARTRPEGLPREPWPPVDDWPEMLRRRGEHLVAALHREKDQVERLLARERATLGASTSEWPPLNELTPKHGPGFPVEALAPWHRQYVEELAAQVQMPVGAPATASLGILAGAVAKTAVVRIEDGDVHPLNIWTMVVSPSGDGKTPMLRGVRHPIDAAQARMRREVGRQLEERRVENRILRRQISQLVGEAAKAADEGRRARLASEIQRIERDLDDRTLSRPTLTTGDPTQASLIRLMAANSGRLLLITDEAAQVFSRIRQRSPRGAEDIEAMLQAYSGAVIEQHREGRGDLVVQDPALTMVLALQPGPFASVMGVRAYHDKGLLSRFLFAVLPSEDGRRTGVPAPVSTAVREGFDHRVSALLQRTCCASSEESMPWLTFTSTARDLFGRFAEEIDHRMADGDLVGLREWANKARGTVARLSGVLHLADGVDLDCPITEETVARAVAIVRHYIDHARVAYADAAQNAEADDARRIVRWLTNQRVHEFTQAQAVRAFDKRVKSAELEAALDRLVERGYLRRFERKRRGKTGRVPKPGYRVHPGLHRGNRG